MGMPKHRFFDQVRHYFGDVFAQYGFTSVEESCPAGPRGSAIMLLTSDVCQIRFLHDARGDEITIEVGHQSGRLFDVALPFEFLMRTQADGEFYHYPSRTLGLYGEKRIAWQLERLAKMLRPIWPAIFAVLQPDTPENDAFKAYMSDRSRRLRKRRG